MHDEEMIRAKYESLRSTLDERGRRLWAGAEARALGRGGAAAVARATGLTRITVYAGMRELKAIEAGEVPAQGRQRRAGGGRKALAKTDPTLLEDLNKLVDPVTRGEPDSPLLWTSKSTYKLAQELGAGGHQIAPRSVSKLLKRLGFSLQAPSKSREMGTHPDRNAQFEHVNTTTKEFQSRLQPVVSVDAKKKELVGDFNNGGREWHKHGEPEIVRVYDFIDEQLGKAIPYGVYDVTANEGFVSVGIDHDTAEFAVETLLRWWRNMGQKRYPDATELYIVADGGGSNGSRARLWKSELQYFAHETGLKVTVSHLPPGTSKWNKIEHRMFAHITQNWRGRPLVSHEVIVNLIANTTTRTGLRIQAELDPRQYRTGIKVPADVFANIELQRNELHGRWNYSISPYQD
jgi:transposase